MRRLRRLGTQLLPSSAAAAREAAVAPGRLEGKACVVTGAGSGIGAATAQLFARHGALTVVCCDIDLAAAEGTASGINEEFPGRATALRADVSRPEDAQRTVEACVSACGRLDVYFANAGVLRRLVPIGEETEESFMQSIAVNTLGPFMAIKHASAAMVRTAGGGSIICTGSIAAMRSDLTPLQYTASKGALLSMVTSASDRLMLDNVRVNAVVPGGVLTPMVMGVAKDLREQGLELTGYDMERFPPILPEQIANVVLFLASDESAAVKGHAIVADGGMSNSMGSQPYPQKKKKRSKV